ncbi:MAG: hypothetical protein JO019_04695 [Candidatus Kaiserbacteria bacterium]|nr:hypothetical protein [Candidatus Kaiserbacteria bacterium]
MAPSIAIKVVGQKKKPLKILDPMMGSGTVLALAQANGHRTFGIDIDPLAVLISKVWTRSINKKRVRAEAQMLLTRSQRRAKLLTLKHAYPKGADQETRDFISYWFDPIARIQLTALARSITEIRDEKIRDVMWCSLSRLIIAKKVGVSLAMDLSHSRPHKAFEEAPIKPFDKFVSVAGRVIDSCVEIGDNKGHAPIIRKGDARNLPIKTNSIDLVLTSPPYLNAIDYIRCSKFSLVWMGHRIKDLRVVRSTSVGSELGSDVASHDEQVTDVLDKLKLRPQLSPRNTAILARYVYDMRESVREVARVLAPKGKAVYVVGENTLKGTYIRNSALMKEVAEQAGLAFRGQQVRILPNNRRYLPPPTKKRAADLDVRMRREVVMTFQKSE